MTLENKLTDSKYPCILLSGIIALAALFYYPTLKSYFIVDDFMWLEVVADRGLSQIGSFFTDVRSVGFYRPFIKLSFWLDYCIYGINQQGYHITNIILHCINIVLVFMLIMRLCKNNKTAILSCLIFALHPMHTESISYLSGRTELIHGLFYLTCLLSFIGYLGNQSNRRLNYLSLAAFILSLLTKETAVSLIIILYLTDLLFRFKNNQKINLLDNKAIYAPYVVFLFAYIILRQFVIGATVYKIRFDDMLFRPIYYFMRIFMPVNMQSPWIKSIASIITQNIILLIPIGLFFLFVLYYISYHLLYKESREDRYLLYYCLCWIVIIFFPVYFNPGERYAYLPSIGSALISSMLIIKGLERLQSGGRIAAKIAKPLLGIILIGIISFCYVRITERNAIFDKVGKIARNSITQLIQLQPEILQGTILYFINPPEYWIRESEIWTRPFFTTFDKAVRVYYHDLSLNIYYSREDRLIEQKDKIDFLIKSGFKKAIESKTDVLVFEYGKDGLSEKQAEYRRLVSD